MATTPASDNPTPLRKIIVYSTIGPDADNAAWTAFGLARNAHEAGLEVEVFLAGAATGVMRDHVRGRLEGSAKEKFEAVIAAGVPISLAPG